MRQPALHTATLREEAQHYICSTKRAGCPPVPFPPPNRSHPGQVRSGQVRSAAPCSAAQSCALPCGAGCATVPCFYFVHTRYNTKYQVRSTRHASTHVTRNSAQLIAAAQRKAERSAHAAAVWCGMCRGTVLSLSIHTINRYRTKYQVRPRTYGYSQKKGTPSSTRLSSANTQQRSATQRCVLSLVPVNIKSSVYVNTYTR